MCNVSFFQEIQENGGVSPPILIDASVPPLNISNADIQNLQQIFRDFERDVVASLVQQLPLLSKMEERKMQGRQREELPIISNLRKDLGDLLLKLNKSMEEYPQPGKITD